MRHSSVYIPAQCLAEHAESCARLLRISRQIDFMYEGIIHVCGVQFACKSIYRLCSADVNAISRAEYCLSDHICLQLNCCIEEEKGERFQATAQLLIACPVTSPCSENIELSSKIFLLNACYLQNGSFRICARILLSETFAPARHTHKSSRYTHETTSCISLYPKPTCTR